MTLWCGRTLVTNPYFVGLCTCEADFQKELRRLKVPVKDWPTFNASTHANATVHFFESDTGKTAIVCMTPRPDKEGIQLAAMLVHEAVHIWQGIRDELGEKTPSAEFEAYSIQAISQNLMQAYKQATQ